MASAGITFVAAIFPSWSKATTQTKGSAFPKTYLIYPAVFWVYLHTGTAYGATAFSATTIHFPLIKGRYYKDSTGLLSPLITV